MTHIKGTPKTHRESPPRPDGGHIYYDEFSRRATVQFHVPEGSTELILIRRSPGGIAKDKFFQDRDFKTVRVHVLPDQGAIVMVEANPRAMDWRIIGTLPPADTNEVLFQQAFGPLERIRVFRATPHTERY